MATDRFGIDDSYHDARGVAHETVARNARGAASRHGRRARNAPRRRRTTPDAVRVLLPGGDRALHGAMAGGADLVLEDGTLAPARP